MLNSKNKASICCVLMIWIFNPKYYMKRRIILATILLCLLASGCTQKQEQNRVWANEEQTLDSLLLCEPGVLVRPVNH